MKTIALSFDRPKFNRLVAALGEAHGNGKFEVVFDGMKMSTSTCTYLMYFLSAMLDQEIQPLCRHPKRLRSPGPRVPARWGSFATEVCVCGAWRTTAHKVGKWTRDPMTDKDED